MTIFNLDDETDIFTEKLSDAPRYNRFAYEFRDLDEIAPNVRAQVDKLLEPGETLERIVFAPQQRGLFKETKGLERLFSVKKWRMSPEWILIVTRKRMILVSITGSGVHIKVDVTPIPYIISLEFGAILLYSWFKWTWLEDNQIRLGSIYYNTVSERIFFETKDYLSRLLCNKLVVIEADNQEDLDSLPYKFRRIIREKLLMREERVVAAVFRSPEWITRFGLIKKPALPAASLVMTNYHILYVQEEFNSPSEKYSFIARFWPDSLVSSLKVREKDNRLEISFLVTRGDHEEEICVGFATNMEHQLREWVDRFLELLYQG